MRAPYEPPTSLSDSSCIPLGDDGGSRGGGRRYACEEGEGWGMALREGDDDATGCCRVRLLLKVGAGGGGRASIEEDRARVQEPGSPGCATKRGDGVGRGALEATRAEAKACVSSAESETSDMETVREREGPVRRSCPCGIGMPMLGPSPVLSPMALKDCPSSTPSILMLFLRPRCRSRSIPRHISSVTPKRSRQRRSCRARESGRVSGLWQMAHGEGWPP